MSGNDGFQGVSNCYVFKSRLQEYAQKVGLPTPVYETIKEGPSHEPSFRSTVIMNDVRYDSLLGFFNRKAAEQSAAEIALVALASSGEIGGCISQPVHETGLCKNLLQEYAQKMNYAIPSYDCRKDEKPGRVALFSCAVEIGGIKYIGAAARTKKEAEIKAARTALLAIQSSASGFNEKPTDNSIYSVIPCRKKVTDLGISSQETAAALKPKKGHFKRKQRKKKRCSRDRSSHDQGKNMGGLEVKTQWPAGPELGQSGAFGLRVTESGFPPVEASINFQYERSLNGNVEGALVPQVNGSLSDGHLTVMNVYQSNLGSPNQEINSMMCSGDLTANKLSGVWSAVPMENSSIVHQGEAPCGLDGLNQTVCGTGSGETSDRTMEAFGAA